MADLRKKESEAAKKLKGIGEKPSTLVQEAGNEYNISPTNQEQVGFQVNPSQGTPATGTPEPIDRREQARGSSTARVGPDGLTYDVVATVNGEPIYGRPIDPEGIANRGEFRKGLSRGTEQLQGLAVGGQAAVADLFGNDEFAETRAMDYQRIMEEAQLFNPGEIHQIEDVETPGQFAAWAAGILGEQVPNIAGYIVSGGIGGVLAKAAAKRIITQQMAKTAMGKLSGFGTKGALAGGWTYGSGLGIGEVYGEQVGEAELSATEGTTKPGAAILGGMGIGTLDVIPVVNVAKKLGFGKQMRGELLREIAKQSRVRRAFMSGAAVAGQEAGTEALQEVIGITARKFVDKNYDVLGEEAASRVLNAAAAGGLVGGVMGAGGGVVESQRARTIQGSLPEGVEEGGVKQGNTPPASEPTPPATPSPSEPMESGPEVVEVNENNKGETTSQQGESYGGGEIVRGQFNLEQQKVGGEVDPGRNVGLRNDSSLPKNVQNLIEAFNKEVNKEGINFKRVQSLQKKIEEKYKKLGSESPFPAKEEVEENFVDTQSEELPFDQEPIQEENVTSEEPVVVDKEGEGSILEPVQEETIAERVEALEEENQEQILEQEQEEMEQEVADISAQEQGVSEQSIVDQIAGEELDLNAVTEAQKNRLVQLSNRVLEGEELTESQATTLEKLQKKARVKKVTRKQTVQEQRELKGEDIVRMKEEVPGSGMTVEQVALAIKPLLDALPLAPNVRVVNKSDLQLDPTLHAEANTSKGLFVSRDGLSEVYLIADNIESGVDSQRVFLHEVVGHSGIRAIFTEQELERFLKLVRGKDETVSLEEAEERVARMAEKISLQKDQLGVFRRVKALVRQALRKITGLELKLNDAEIEGILLNAASYLKGKKGATTPYSMWGPDDRRIVENEVQVSGTENYTKEKVKFIKVLEKGENLREATTRGKIQNKLRGLHITNAERQAVETMLSRVPERFATWGRVIKDLEELFVPMRITKNTDSWNFKGSGMEGNLYFQEGSLIGMDVVQGDANYLANRMARESYRYAAQRRKNYFRYATKETVEHLGGDPKVYQAAERFFEEHLDGEKVERGGEVYRESPVRFIDDNLPVPSNFDKQSTLIRQSGIDIPARNQLEDDTYWLLRVNQLGYMKFKQWMMTPLQIMKTTRGEVPETEQHVRNVEAWYQTKIEIIDEAEKVLTGYVDENGVKHNGLRGRSKESLARLGAALFEATHESDHSKGGVLTNEQKMEIFRNNNLTEEEVATFSEVDLAFKKVLRRIERGVLVGEARRWINDLIPDSKSFIGQFYNTETGVFNREGFIQEIERLRSANPSREEGILSARNAILESHKDFNKLSSRTYFPYKRFGKYGIKVQAAKDFTDEDGNSWSKGQIVSFTTYDSKLVLEKDWKLNPEIRKYLKSENTFVKDTVLTDEARSYLEFPPGLWKYLEQDGNLNLTDVQRQELQNIYASFSPGKGFAKQLLKRKGVPGFSRDVLRVYSSYMFSAANHTARVEWKDALNESLESINQRNQESESGTIPGMVYNYFQEHLDYIMNPKEEWSKLRAWGFIWYLGFNVKSAIVNLTQVPLVGYPYLAARYGDGNSVREILDAAKTVSKMLTGKKNHNLTVEEDKLLQAVKERGVGDQSQVSSMAEYTEGEALGRWTTSTRAGMAQESFFRAAGWLFHHAEIQNRRVMALASYRLQVKAGLDPVADFDKIVEDAVDAVQATQFEYSKWNRPKFMRGRMSVVFLFWQYMQQASFLAFGGEGKGTAARYWGMMLFAGGLMGLPFMDDLLDLVDFFGKSGKAVMGMEDTRTDSELFIREMLAEHVDNPDLFMNGASRYYGLGPLHLLSLVGMPIPEVDISGSISMGDVLPLTDKLAGNREVDAAGLGRGVEDAAGAVFQIGYNAMKAVTSNDPDTWKTWERAMPIAAKNISKSIRLFSRGEETSSDGSTFLSYEPNQADAPSRAELMGEIVAQGLGFASSRAGVKWDYMMAQMDAITWHTTRRGMLLDDMAWAKQWNDREVLADIRKSIRRYNASVPNPNLKITQDTIRRSLRERRRRQELKERGLPAQRSYQGISREIQEGFPEISFD